MTTSAPPVLTCTICNPSEPQKLQWVSGTCKLLSVAFKKCDAPAVELGLQCGKVAVQGQLGGRVHGLAGRWHHSRHGGHHHYPAVPPGRHS